MQKQMHFFDHIYILITKLKERLVPLENRLFKIRNDYSRVKNGVQITLLKMSKD